MTLQIQDKLLYKGETSSLNQELLEPYFTVFPDRKPPSPGMMSSLWRGYVATFEIAEEQLFVKDISVFADIELNQKSVLKHAFPDSNKFEWYSGYIRFEATRLGFMMEQEDTTFKLLEIQEGNFIQELVMDLVQLQDFKVEQFEHFKLTEKYQEAVAGQKKKGMIETEIDELIKKNMLFFLGLGLFTP